MQKIQPTRLIEMLLTPPKKPSAQMILCDDELFKRLTLETFSALRQGTPKAFAGKTGIGDFVNDAGAGSLFAPAAPAIVELEPKLTAKQWDGEKKNLSRIPNPPEAPVIFFGATALRNVVKESDFPGEVRICWSPDDAEARRCVEILIRRHGDFRNTSPQVFETWVNSVTDYYSGDLSACDCHFERMARTGVDFEGAFIGQTGTTAFHVVDALAQGDAALVELKMQQCATSGEDSTPILKAVSAFLRQLAAVQAGLARTSNQDMVFDNLNIRVPAQRQRLRRGLQHIGPQRIATFFLVAPHLEMSLRSHPTPHEHLSLELMGLLSPKK
jgi:hypothetical protein